MVFGLPYDIVNTKAMRPITRISSYTYRTIIYLVLIMIGILAVSTEILAQSKTSPNFGQGSDYKYAFGVRAGGSSGLTFKTFIGPSAALEFIAWGNGNHLGVAGLYERYVNAFDVAGLNWYYGGGAHAKLHHYQSGRSDLIYPDNAMAIGVDGIAGIEYKIAPIPVAVSIDLKPNLEVWTTGGVGLGIDPGLGVKLAF